MSTCSRLDGILAKLFSHKGKEIERERKIETWLTRRCQILFDLVGKSTFFRHDVQLKNWPNLRVDHAAMPICQTLKTLSSRA